MYPWTEFAQTGTALLGALVAFLNIMNARADLMIVRGSGLNGLRELFATRMLTRAWMTLFMHGCLITLGMTTLDIGQPAAAIIVRMRWLYLAFTALTCLWSFYEWHTSWILRRYDIDAARQQRRKGDKSEVA